MQPPPPTRDQVRARGERTAPRVHVRPEALGLRRPGDGPGTTVLPAPDADRALDTLRSFGFEVVLLPAGLEPTAVSPRDWLLTDDAADCRWARRAGARTVLVGAEPASQAGQPERCDVAVGSIYGAAIEVVICEPDPQEGEP